MLTYRKNKGGETMACTHERIKSVNCRIFCDICGAEMTVDDLMGKHKTEPAKAAETPENKQETPKKTTRKRKA